MSDVIGQPAAVPLLTELAAEPFPVCRLLVGPPGCGKTTAALAFAAQLGCEDAFSDLHILVGADLTIDVARDLWTVGLRFSPRSSSGFKILLIEELERLSPAVQIFLKDALERNLPARTIVIATSNDSRRLDAALLQRFGPPLEFSGGADFAAAAAPRLAAIWSAESGGQPLPQAFASWGWSGRQFSLRSALDAMQDCLTVSRAAA